MFFQQTHRGEFPIKFRIGEKLKGTRFLALIKSGHAVLLFVCFSMFYLCGNGKS